MKRRQMTAVGASLFVILLVLLGGTGASARPVVQSADTTNWPSFGNTLDQMRHSPLTQITPGNIDQLGRAFTFDLNKVVPGIKKGQQTYPDRRRRDDVRHLERQPGLRRQRGDRRPALALRARQRRHLQELRNRGEPRRRGLRQPRLRAHARHDDRRARPEDGPAARPGADRARREGRHRELRLLRDERTDLREPSPDRRRSRVGVRRTRLRHGLQHARPHAGVGQPVLDDPAGQHRVAEARASRRRLHGLDAADRGREHGHDLLRDSSGRPAVLPVTPSRVEPALLVADRGRPGQREAEVVAAADRRRTSGRTTPRSLRSSTRRRSAATPGASSRSPRWKASGSPTTLRPAPRSTSA